MFEKIEKLLDAGFTKDEIMKMLPKEPEPAKDPEPEKKEPEQKPEEPAKNEKQEKQEEKKPEPEPFNTQPFTDAIKSMEDAMQAMNAKMQRLALSMYDGPEPKKNTVPDILIKVIDPVNVNKKGE